KGQLLAEMDSRDYLIQLSATEAEYKRVQAEAERIIALYEKGSATANDHDKAVFGLKQITAKYEAHKNALADTKLIAPFDGYVQRLHFEAGETIGAGMPVISLISSSLPEVEINIPSSDFMHRQRFEEFWCSIDIFPDKIFPLELIGVAQKANLNQLYAARLKMITPAQQMPAPGMTAMVTIQYKANEKELMYVPFSAILEKNGGATVWVYNSSLQTVEARPVTVSEILRNGKVIISEGLREGEIVITAGVRKLCEGEKVKPLPAVSPTNVGGML
ncbi:MAG: efflux RND transporter periplasmic adaptor subunit, partial [Bacteroidales bacterium]|nr:efflux RND transporter periplasmic adaptor subunit [Bacteroidales bacterium]